MGVGGGWGCWFGFNWISFVFYTNSLEIIFYFQPSEVTRLLLVEVNVPLRLKLFICVFTRSLHRFRHLSLMLCLQLILYAKLILDLTCSLSESYWIQWKLASEIGLKSWAPKFSLDCILTPKLHSLVFTLCDFSKSINISCRRHCNWCKISCLLLLSWAWHKMTHLNLVTKKSNIPRL